MQTIQFDAKVFGGTIRLPYWCQANGEDANVTVTFTKPKLYDDDGFPEHAKGAFNPDAFTPFIDTRGFKFDREEAY
jgi:hypothetical protein